MFSMIHTNISLPKNFGNLVIFLRFLNRNISCVGISETWLGTISPIDTFNISNYSFLDKSHSSRRGGVGIYVQNTYNFKERTANFEKTLIGVIYRTHEYTILMFLMNMYKQCFIGCLRQEICHILWVISILTC